MEFSILWPINQVQWGAWSSAAITFVFGLVMFLAPRIGFRIRRLQPIAEKPEAIAEGRATMAGFYLGVSLCCLILGPQLFLFMALGFSWLFTAFGRLLAMMSDGANTPYNWVSVIVELVLASAPLALAFGFEA
jgi:hypothetical protein